MIPLSGTRRWSEPNRGESLMINTTTMIIRRTICAAALAAITALVGVAVVTAPTPTTSAHCWFGVLDGGDGHCIEQAGQKYREPVSRPVRTCWFFCSPAPKVDRPDPEVVDDFDGKRDSGSSSGKDYGGKYGCGEIFGAPIKQC
jgi:hypothetical protein